MNQVNIIGNIGGEPDVKSFQSGKKVARFSIAINACSKDKGNRLSTNQGPMRNVGDDSQTFS